MSCSKASALDYGGVVGLAWRLEIGWRDGGWQEIGIELG